MIFDDAFREELKQEPHHYGEVTFLESVLEPGMNVIEIGGNRGVTALSIGRAVQDTGHVYVFEPVPDFYTELESNVSQNSMHNMTLFNRGLSSESGRCPFYSHGDGSGVTESDDAELIEVEMTTLDGFMQEPDVRTPVHMINMDCEGSELNVLKSGMNTLRRDRSAVFCEVHAGYLGQLGQSVDDIVNLLKDVGYSVKPVQAEELDSEPSYDTCSHVFACGNQAILDCI